MSTAAGQSDVADRLGFGPGMVVQELGWDEDTDDEVRLAIEDAIDAEMVDEAVEAVDVVVLWWRDGDGDLIDALVDSLTDLADDGYVWLFTPKVGRDGYVDVGDVNESATTAGLSATTTQQVGNDWSARKLVGPKGGRR